MKKFLAIIFILLIFSGCVGQKPIIVKRTPYPTSEPIPTPDDIIEKTDYVTEQWVSIEIPFTAKKLSKNISDTVLDIIFINRSTGKKIIMPGFWNGENNWAVRFAPTECGIWDYETVATGEDVGISGIKGTLACNAYKGKLDIYKHGFVKTETGKKYFVYADGTPFFYLGDTHFSMVTEGFNSIGLSTDKIDSDSQFKYIVDQRVKQGFTVYQSQTMGTTINVSDGKINENDIKGFKEMDKYFQYIASKGLVHANSKLLMPNEVTNNFNSRLEELTRYWIARYASYPVMWTLGDEADDAKNQEYDMLVITYLDMCAYVDKYDPYNHPTSAHQLDASVITCAGGVFVEDGVTRKSAFYSTKGHAWWATQWKPTVNDQYNVGIPKDYWENGSDKPIVNYESRIHCVDAVDFTARAQAWITYLSGMSGYAYSGKDILWADLINAPISKEMTYLRGFMESIGWWELTPDFDYGKAFKKPENKECLYAAANIGNEVYVVYLYNRTSDSVGKLVNMDKNATYIAQWFDTRTGEYSLIDHNLKADKNGEYNIPQKPISDDMVLLVMKK